MRKKLSNIAASGAKCVALDCPGCAMQLAGGADKEGLGLRVAHVAELLADALAPAKSS